LLGRPVGNTRLYVLDAHKNPVPIAVPGELFIAGSQLARGYFGHPDLSAERFFDLSIPGTDISERLYKTGDLVRWLPSGNLEFLGRIDHSRRFRIELGEIESVLRAFPLHPRCRRHS